MDILIVSEKLDTERIIKCGFSDVDFELSIDSLHEENYKSFTKNHDYGLAIINDKYFTNFSYNLRAFVFSMLLKNSIPTLVLLEDKSRVDLFSGTNLVDYFYYPIDWQRVQLRLNLQAKTPRHVIDEKTNAVPDKFVVKIKNEVILKDYDEIIFFEKDAKKLFVHLEDDVLTVQESIKVLMTRVPDNFVRVHNSYVVNTKYISKITEVGNRSYHIQFENYDKVALMSRYRSDALLKDHYRLTKNSVVVEEKSS
ncbi:LytTR family transcriptional regulator [Acidaminobacter sp. JC074]|uniref:LytR/AlgR family response regulator transcription factor n=1 Tax=Acidaminobacter sp. JC074 TaxID=2530199 RepID=UPI001F10D162|nr:LytTR family DNA-binding domain-containing protein [Acidaminobacter sp. JC074]MCH4890644.1 LytTR family transcriptional regulator [Acidaminobacter sp. JC074]